MIAQLSAHVVAKSSSAAICDVLNKLLVVLGTQFPLVDFALQTLMLTFCSVLICNYSNM
jgi:hypothetical protein